MNLSGFRRRHVPFQYPALIQLPYQNFRQGVVVALAHLAQCGWCSHDDKAFDIAFKNLLVQHIRDAEAEAVLVCWLSSGFAELLVWRPPEEIFELSTSAAGIAFNFTFAALPSF
jgi:hypothetical protein